MNTSTIIIEKIPPEPPIHPVSENHEENQGKIAGRISTNGGTIPPRDKIPPAQNTQNHVQNQRLVIHCHSYFY